MIMAGPYVGRGVCETLVSLWDVPATIADHFGVPLDVAKGRAPLGMISKAPKDTTRVVFSEDHAPGAVSGAFMLRKVRWKPIHSVGFEDELFDLEADPEEVSNAAGSAENAGGMTDLHSELRHICGPQATNGKAFADQAALIEQHGGYEVAMKLGAPGATPPPDVGM